VKRMAYNAVVGVDGSPHSEAALRWALADAEKHDGQVTALFVWQVPFSSFPGLFDREALEKASKEFLIERVSAVEPTPSVPLLPLVAEGDPSEALIAASNDADLLVLGTRGRSRLVGLLVGSVSMQCAAAARCPVVLIKEGYEPSPLWVIRRARDVVGAQRSGVADGRERVQGSRVRLDVGVSRQRPLGDEPQDYRLEQLRHPLGVGAGVKRPGRLPPAHRVGDQLTLRPVGGAGGRLEFGVALRVAPAVDGGE
jgi:nucleotide-binding universal stress UspA family protein